MEPTYAVYLRGDSIAPETCEVQVAEFATYPEARRLSRELCQAGRLCVIRCTGQTGGSE